MVSLPVESNGAIPFLTPTRDLICNCWPTADPCFHERKEAAFYKANKCTNNKLLLSFVSVIARGLFFVKTTVADRPPKIYVLLKGCFSRIRPSDSAGEGGCCCDIEFAGRQFRLANAILLFAFWRVCQCDLHTIRGLLFTVSSSHDSRTSATQNPAFGGGCRSFSAVHFVDGPVKVGCFGC